MEALDTPGPDAAAGPHRLLLVEDDDHLRRAMVRVLADFQVDAVSTCAQARVHMLAHPYLAWLVDLRLPDGDGIDLVAWAYGQGLETPTLVLTAHETRAVVDRTQRLGIELAYKPDTKANIHAFLGRALEGRRVISAVRSAADRFSRANRLSERERELVGAYVRGVPRAKLDVELGVTENTVKTLIRRILRKVAMGSLDDVLQAVLSQRDGDVSR